MDRHIWQRLATVVLVALVISSISIFSPVGNGDGLGITTIQAERGTHQLSSLLNQQIVVLMGLDINPNWIREQSAADSLTCDIVKPNSMVPAGVNEDYSYLVTNSRGKGTSLSFRVGKRKVTIKYVSHGEKLHTRTIPLSRLAKQSYRAKKQRQQMNKYASVLWTE